MKMGPVNPPKECLVCLNSVETTFVSNEQCQKIFNVCCSYIKDAINIEFLINNIKGNNSQLSFCKNCCYSSLNISKLVEQLSTLKKEINDLVSCFSETIGKQRIQATANYPAAIQYENGNCKNFRARNHQRENLETSDMLLLHAKQTESVQGLFMQLETSNELIGEQIAIDEISSEIVKIESDGIFPDYEEDNFSDNGSDYKEEDIATNYVVTGNENEVDPLGEIELDVNNFCNIEIEAKPQITTTNGQSASFVPIPNNRIQNDVLSTRDDTSNSTKTYQDERGINVTTFNQTFPVRSGLSQRHNSTTKTTNVKRNARKKKIKYNCSICLKGFDNPAHLKRHTFTHTGEKPFQCSLCQRSFNRSDHLKSHQRIHSEDRPYRCSFCEKSFRYPISLKDHERSHTGETFKCCYCECTFKYRRARLEHQNNYHHQWMI